MLVRRWLLAASFAILGAALIGLIAGGTHPDRFALVALIFAACTLGPLLALGWLVFVSPTTVPQDKHRQDSVEARWSDTAAAGAWRDTVIATSAVLVVVSIFGYQWRTSYVLLGVVVVAMLSLAIRHAALSQKEG